MRGVTPMVGAIVLILSPTVLRAQNAGLSGLLLRFFAPSNPIILAQTGHDAHFGSQPNAQETMIQLNRGIASQLATFPLGSSSGGFAYTFDPALGVFARSTDSFGPLFAERALTSGKGKVSFGLNYVRSDYDAFEGLNLHDGDIRFFLTHRDVNRDGDHFEFYFEGDRIEADLFLKVKSETSAFFANYGVTDRLDVGFAIPYIRLDLDARIRATILHLATLGDPFVIHVFQNGTDQNEFRERGSAEGLGDLVLRGKYRLKKWESGGMALALDLRLPTADEQDLLGSGATQAKFFLVASSSGKFSPHVNAGYTFSRGGAVTVGRLPDEINYTVGFDAAVLRRLTLTGDVIGRTLRNANRLVVTEEEWEYNHLSRGRVETATFPRIVTESGDLNVLLGSAGIKFNPFGKLLISANVLLSQGKRGLQDYVTPVVAVDYSF